MSAVAITPIQAAAKALVEHQVEPLIRGMIVVPVDGIGPMPLIAISPEGEYPQRLHPDYARVLAGRTAVVVVVNDDSFAAAAQDALDAHRVGAEADLVATVLVSRGRLLEPARGDEPVWLGEVLATMPTRALSTPTELGIWAPTRTPQFDATSPHSGAVDIAELREKWVHCAITGQTPDPQSVAELAAAMGDVDQRDELLTAALRLAWAELADDATAAEAMRVMLGSTDRPDVHLLVRFGLVAAFAAAHTVPGPEAAQLHALGGLMMWAAYRSGAAASAAQLSLVNDASCSLGLLVERLAAVATPPWTLA